MFHTITAQYRAPLMLRPCFWQVNCTDNMPNFHEDKPHLKYLRFDVSNWSRYMDHTDQSVHRFVKPLFSFVTEGLEAGESVMVHCLAGAHRAGTTGCACLMHFAKWVLPCAYPVSGSSRFLLPPSASSVPCISHSCFPLLHTSGGGTLSTFRCLVSIIYLSASIVLFPCSGSP